MVTRIAVIHGTGESVVKTSRAATEADLLIAWCGDRSNVAADYGAVRAPGEPELGAATQDLLEIATALYVADIAVKRGERERWPRNFELVVPVRDVELWESVANDLQRLIYELTRDTVLLHFRQLDALPSIVPTAHHAPGGVEADCVSTLSGGLDSLAGAVMLQQTGRRPIYSLHRSGNPAVRRAQEQALATIETHWPEASTARPCVIEPSPRGEDALPFPPPEEREPSRRCRSLLFMALALATAEAGQVDEAYMCENGVLTAGLPFSAARAGSMSTHSTHPLVLALMNRIAAAADMRARMTNPFVYQTKAELIRDVLAPNLSAQEIQSTVSCWAVGRANRQCGGCVPCLLRQIGMAWAELPEEAYMMEVLARPKDYVGTDAYGNLVDMLRQAEHISRRSDAEVLASQPGLLSLHAAGVDMEAVVAMLRRHADQTLTVVRERYPNAARLLD